MVHRNMQADVATGQGAEAAQITEHYFGVRLLRDLAAQDRARLLDLAVFDWIEADLVQDVLGSSDAMARVTGLRALDGLLSPIGGDGSVRRLHPLLRDYCLARLSSESPARKRSLHRRVALALARRGDLTPAWRHAAEAGDSRLLASSRIRGILEFRRPQDVVVLAASSDRQRARVLADVKARRSAPPPLSRGSRP